MSAPDNDTLRALLAAAPPGPWRALPCRNGSWQLGRDVPCGWRLCTDPECRRGWLRIDGEHGAALAAAAPALAAEVLRLRERAERAEAAHDALRTAVRDFLDTPASCYGVALQAVVDALADAAPSGIADAVRAHLAAADALTLARRTDAADVPAAEARALAARDTLAALVGYTGEVRR